jgi:Protein of unknown function (DUF2490)
MKLINPSASLALAGLILLCLAGAASAQTLIRVPERDVQFWNDVQFTIPMSKKVDFVLQGTLRLGDNISQPVDERWGIGFVFKLGKYLTFSPSFFSREAKAPGGRREREVRGTLTASVRVPLGKKFTLADRNSFERRERRPQIDAWRYRNRLTVEHPFIINKHKFTLLVSDEVFYDWSLRDWVRNRFAVGVSHVFNKHFTLDLYGMRQNDGRTRPSDINIIGTVWRFRL